MKDTTKNAVAVTACCLSLTLADAVEQFSPVPRDLTSPLAQYAGGTVVPQPADGYVTAPPHSPIELRLVLKEWRPGA
jgi:hypothetical protein